MMRIQASGLATSRAPDIDWRINRPLNCTCGATPARLPSLLPYFLLLSVLPEKLCMLSSLPGSVQEREMDPLEKSALAVYEKLSAIVSGRAPVLARSGW